MAVFSGFRPFLNKGSTLTGAQNTFFANTVNGAHYLPDTISDWRRNLLTFSEQFNNSVWVSAAATVTPNATVAPDGTTTADLLRPSETSAVHSIAIARLNLDAFVSVYVKAAGYTKFALINSYGSWNGSKGVLVDLSSGTLLAGNQASAFITPVGNDWYRIGAFIGAGVTDIKLVVLDNAYPGIATSPNTYTYTADGTSGIYIWGAQAELGSVATSYQRITDANTEAWALFPNTTMFQDSYAAAPATETSATTAQSVGLWLDKSKLLTRGSELIVNGDFSNGTTGWTGYTSTISVVNGRLRVVNLDNDTRFTGQSVPTVSGKTYELSFDYDCGTATNIAFAAGSALGANDFLPYTLATGSGTIKRVFLVTSATTFIYLGGWTNNSGKEYFFDNVSVKEISGNHARQTSAALRSLLGRAPASRRNLLTRTEDFSGWVNTNTTITGGQIALDGASTARLFGSASTWEMRLNPTFSGTGTFSIYAKKSIGSTITVLCVSQVAYRATFNFDTQQFSGIGSSIIATSYEALPNNWYRIVIVGSNLALTGVNGPGVAGLAANYAFVWGPQFEAGSVATPYQKVVSALDITESGKPSYAFIRPDLSDDVLVISNLVNIKNLVRCSEEFDNVAWSKFNATITPNVTAAPDGSITADALVPSAVETRNLRYTPGFISTSFPYTVSVYAKANQLDQVTLYIRRGVNDRVYGPFNLTNVTVTPSIEPTIVSNLQITDVGNGWRRLSAVCNDINITVFGFSASGTAGVNSTNSLFLWGAQLELGSTATAYEYGGLKGTALVAGRNGTAIENITLPDGVFSLGPVTYTGGTTGILRAVGDIVGYTVTRTSTSVEQDQLIDLYKLRGAKGRLIAGPELWTGSDPVSYVYTGTAITTWDAPTKTFTVNTTGTGQARAKFTLPMVAGKYYFCSYSFAGTIGQFATDPTLGGVAAISNNSVVLARDTGVWFIDAGGLTQGGTLVVSSLSVKELRPKEEW